MLRGELAIAALVILTIVMLIDVVSGNGKSFGLWLGVVVTSAILTLITKGINSLFGNKRREP